MTVPAKVSAYRRNLCRIFALFSIAGGFLGSADSLFGKGWVNPTLSPRPAWISSAAWNEGENKLVTADIGNNVILVYDLSGRYIKVVSSLKNLNDGFYPSRIASYKDGFLLENKEGHMVFLDHELRIKHQFIILGTRRPGVGTIRSVFNWVVTEGNLITFSDIELDGGGWDSAFVRIPLADPSDFVILERMEVSDPGREFYLLGTTYLSTVNSNIYFVKMEERPILMMASLRSENQGAVVLGKSRLFGLLADRPEIPRNRGFGNAREIFDAVENSALVSGLYGVADQLYMIIRRPRSIGRQAIWLVARINEFTGEIDHVVALPTGASHLTVAAGEKRWAFFEKGKVEKFGEQDIAKVLIAEASLLAEPGSDWAIGEVELEFLTRGEPVVDPK